MELGLELPEEAWMDTIRSFEELLEDMVAVALVGSQQVVVAAVEKGTEQEL